MKKGAHALPLSLLRSWQTGFLVGLLKVSGRHESGVILDKFLDSLELVLYSVKYDFIKGIIVLRLETVSEQ